MQNSAFPSPTSNLISNLTKAINGEFTAIHFYEHLAKLAPTQEIQNRILEIRNDEMRHFQGFSNSYFSITGHYPTPQITEEMPNNFKQGVLGAFKDEQEAVEFYHLAARQAGNSYIAHQFQSNASDEQNHAVWFLYFMTHY
ncbi:ferritin-like domain-containing protein [Solibacillus sp. FSL K6-1781]|uniref:Uncharacterized conserved protein n=2 Tax=Solibacillus TaxID=648800 RepID=F2F848_SOLSS|nr:MULTISPECIES: ferritin-like domain-containing protein [Solibacillus]AMO84496.1 rubrerythrin family protein [Solibacillus silvestris]EKB47068.1 hypothetical protein B857_00357 [Solibacillus isronensis B3W22]OBW58715.1 rubrerythrin family protein [Solibacillus silvestris]BAK17613.1 uncharacterized conserved protein [Solibacillus silvestris StLB046]